MTDRTRPGPPELVWYAGYGSNLCAERFLCYLAGGIPPGRSDPSPGARDRTPPRRDRPVDIPHQLYFTGTARAWGGAPCFIDTLPSPDRPTRGRAYLITWDQFEDVVAQENGRATAPIDLDLDLDAAGLTARCGVRLGPGRYETLLYLGSLDGFPVVTITSPLSMNETEPGEPSSTYLKVMLTGLRQSHAMSDDAIVAYLGAVRGCSEELVRSALAPRTEVAPG